MIHLKMQMCCIFIVLYLSFVYFRDSRMFNHHIKHRFYPKLILLTLLTLFLDCLTSYYVNHLYDISVPLLKLLHGLYYVSIIAFVSIMSFYLLRTCGAIPRRTIYKTVLYIPLVLGLFFSIVYLPRVRFVSGSYSNYSIGVSVYACMLSALLYILLLAFIIIKHWKYLESHKKVSYVSYLVIALNAVVQQFLFPESLAVCGGLTLLCIAMYLNLDDPALRELSRHDNDAITCFADIIENRDNSTGGHIKRTSIYVKLISDELRRRGMYHDILTNDYVNNLIKAAPMHDIGKVAIPDSILQKPGRLTAEEFEVMKTHSAAGGRIIRESFANLGTAEFRKMAYELALYHHEKWNGKGYPDGLAGTEIPLCARILSVADVFDALSEKRCYRDAMPLDECFRIIEEGCGFDFEPLIVDCFLSVRDKVEKVHNDFEENTVNL